MPAALYYSIRQLTSENEIGLYSLLITTLQILLYKWYGRSNVTIAGAGISIEQSCGKRAANLHSLKVVPTDTFGASVKENYERLLEGWPYLNLDRDALSLLWTTVLGAENLIPEFGICVDTVSSREVDRPDVAHLVHIASDGDGLTIFVSSKHLSERSELSCLPDHYLSILQGFVDNASATIAELDSMSSDEKQIVTSFSVGNLHVFTERSIIQMVQTVVLNRPNSTAISCDGVAVSYTTLHATSKKLAHLLKTEYGISNGARVGIMMSHSEWLPIAVLGVMNSGSAFVPIDPSFPPSRVAAIIEDSEINLIITDSIVYQIALGFSASLLALDVQLTWTNEESVGEDEQQKINEDSLAYILYTSGTTGKPKGVAVGQISLINYIKWSNEHYFKDDSGKVFGWFTSLSFDLSLTGLLGTLIRGDELVIYPSTDPAGALGNIFRKDSRITATKITPSHLTLLSGLADTGYSPLRAMIVGGEALSRQQVAVAEHRAPNVIIYNEYGPTEATVGCMVKTVSSSSPVTIGKPIDNVSVFILNKDGQLLPPGLRGEIHISGLCLAHGYWKNAAETNQRFIYGLNTRLYRSGDLGRWLSAGDLLYEGRNDHQVKINGHRIELAEISSVFESYPGVVSALTIPRISNERITGVLCYFVGNATPELLTEFGRQMLPVYMIPDVFIGLDHFPLTDNGKVDLARLPLRNTNDEVVPVPASNQLESEVLAIYCAVLGNRKLGTNSNFFHEGGDSIQAIQLISRITAVLGIHLEIKDVFDFPTAAGLTNVIQTRRGNARIVPSLIEEQEYYSATQAQLRLWVIAQFQGVNMAYHQHAASIISGLLDIDSCQYSFRKLISRHESLRSRFFYKDNELKFIIDPLQDAHLLTYQDLRSLKNKEEEVQQRVSYFSSEPFDLLKGPLVKGYLFRVYDDRYVLLIQTHHIVSDGWSWGLMRRELSEYYDDRVQGRTEKRPHVEFQFKEYAAFQKEWNNSLEFFTAQNYWKNMLDGDLPRINLPAYQPRPPVQTFNGRSLEINVDTKKVNRLRQLGNENDATLFMVLIAIVNLLLYKVSGQRDIIIGTDAASRTKEAFQETIGFFLDAIVLRNRINPDHSFSKLIAKVRESTLGAFTHQQYPFDNLIDDLELERDMSRTPIFDVLVIMQVRSKNLIESDVPSNAKQHVQTGQYPLKTVSSLVDLEINFSDHQFGLDINVRYNTDLFLESQIKSIMNGMINLIDQVTFDPESPVRQHQLLSPSEILTQINECCGTVRCDDHSNVIAALSECAGRFSHRIALIEGDCAITHGFLHVITNRIANYLMDVMLIQPGERIGIYGDGSINTILFMIGIMKARGAFVPIDNMLPATRANAILKDAGVRVVFAASADSIRSSELEVVTGKTCLAYGNETSVKYIPSSEDIAYVIYTSGTTGMPKGVPVHHRGLCDYAYSFLEFVHLEQEDRVVHQASISFDTSIEEIFPVLIAGGSVLVVPEADRKDVTALLDQIKIYRPSIVSVTPVYINELKDHSSELRPLKALISGGQELLSAQYGDLWKNGNLYNTYGPSETTVCVTVHRVSQADQSNIIGRPMANHAVYILNEDIQLQPPGLEGEICIVGLGVSNGYLNAPAQTTGRFIDNPFGRGLLYRTGDIGTYLNGEIIFRGRKDDQIKIRGYRIETQEIEEAIRAMEGITDVAVLLMRAHAEEYLTAFVVADQMPLQSEIDRYLRGRLPAYMLPASYIHLDTLPITSTGKLDKDKLRKNHHNTRGEVVIEASTPTEHQLVHIWKDVLQRNEVGVNQNFFSLGGHSLKAARVINEIIKQYNITLNMAVLFERPTVGELASLIDSMLEKRDDGTEISITI